MNYWIIEFLQLWMFELLISVSPGANFQKFNNSIIELGRGWQKINYWSIKLSIIAQVHLPVFVAERELQLLIFWIIETALFIELLNAWTFQKFKNSIISKLPIMCFSKNSKIQLFKKQKIPNNSIIQSLKFSKIQFQKSKTRTTLEANPRKPPGPAQEAPGPAQEAPKRPQDAPKRPQDAPKRPQEAPKTAPRGHQQAAKCPQEPPRSPQEATSQRDYHPTSPQEATSQRDY